MLKSKSIAALTFAAILAASGQGYAQTQADPHHPDQGAGKAQAAPETQNQPGMSIPMMMNMMAGMMKMMGGAGNEMGMNRTEHVEGRIAFLRAELQITEAQAKAWDVFAGFLREDAKRMKEADMPMMKDAKQPQFVTQLELRERMLASKLEEVRATKAAYAALDQVLSEDQRRMVGELLKNHMDMMPAGMMQGGMMPMQQNSP
jgi:hypothetical protein